MGDAPFLSSLPGDSSSEPSRVHTRPPDGGEASAASLLQESMADDWIPVANRKNRSRVKFSPFETVHPTTRVSNPPLSDKGKMCMDGFCQVRSSKPPSSSASYRFTPCIASSAKPMSWASIVSGNRFYDANNLSFIPPSVDNGCKFAVITKEEVSATEDFWANSLMVYVVGSRPHFHSFQENISRIWNPSGNFQLFSRDNGFFLVKLSNDAECIRILEDGPWMFNGKLLIIRRWSFNLSMDRDLLKTIPVWIRLPSLNLKLWNPLSIAKIASLVGVPL